MKKNAHCTNIGGNKQNQARRCTQQNRCSKKGNERRRNLVPIFNTFPDVYPSVASIVQDVAFILREHALLEGGLVTDQGHVHGAISIRNLAGRRTTTVVVEPAQKRKQEKQFPPLTKYRDAAFTFFKSWFVSPSSASASVGRSGLGPRSCQPREKQQLQEPGGATGELLRSHRLDRN